MVKLALKFRRKAVPMKKGIVRLTVIAGILLLLLVGFLNYKNQRIHNIFDEIYYEEDDYYSYELIFRERAFSKIKDIKFYDDDSEDFYQHRVEYQENQLPSNITIMSYHFHFLDSKVPYFKIRIQRKLANADSTINMNY